MLMFAITSLVNCGLMARKSAVSMLLLPAMAVAIASIEWFFIGHSLGASSSRFSFVGDFRAIFLNGLFDASPELSTEISKFHSVLRGLLASFTT